MSGEYGGKNSAAFLLPLLLLLLLLVFAFYGNKNNIPGETLGTTDWYTDQQNSLDWLCFDTFHFPVLWARIWIVKINNSRLSLLMIIIIIIFMMTITIITTIIIIMRFISIVVAVLVTITIWYTINNILSSGAFSWK